ncbi:MAG: DUF2974 domain-containing protein [Treponema sp.]|nr:DUF2974 domain-containing protein [Treponema sp.]
MADILDYVAWRGDLDFFQSPLNEVDALIFSQLSYLNYKGIVGESFDSEKITLSECCKKFFSSGDYEKRSNVGMLINKKTVDLLKACGQSRRFGNLEVRNFLEIIDYENEEQFSALTFTFPAGSNTWNFIAFRGTDDTIVGWKEDFNLGYMDTVPAQKDAVNYLESIASHIKGHLVIGGHSKGGNLALYAGSSVSNKIKKRIIWIFNNDGPGFRKDFFDSDNYKSIAEKERSFVPRLSVIGMLFSHSDNLTTVESGEKNMLMQHDPFSWHVLGTAFVTCNQTGRESRLVDKAVNEWVSELSQEEREMFVETIFTVLNDSKARTNSELSSNLFESVGRMLMSASRLSPKTKNAVSKTVHLLVKSLIEANFSTN